MNYNISKLQNKLAQLYLRGHFGRWRVKHVFINTFGNIPYRLAPFLDRQRRLHVYMGNSFHTNSEYAVHT